MPYVVKWRFVFILSQRIVLDLQNLYKNYMVVNILLILFCKNYVFIFILEASEPATSDVTGKLLFSQFDLRKVLVHGTSLLSTEEKQFELGEEFSGMIYSRVFFPNGRLMLRCIYASWTCHFRNPWVPGTLPDCTPPESQKHRFA